MFDFLKLLLDKSYGLWKRIFVILFSIAAFFFVDTFTGFPSLSFTVDKYEALQKASQIANDTTLNASVRRQAKKDINNLAARKSIRDYYLILFSKKWYKHKDSLDGVSDNRPEIENHSRWGKILDRIFWIFQFFLSSNWLLWLILVFGVFNDKRQQKKTPIEVILGLIVLAIIFAASHYAILAILGLYNNSSVVLLRTAILELVLFMIFGLLFYVLKKKNRA